MADFLTWFLSAKSGIQYKSSVTLFSCPDRLIFWWVLKSVWVTSSIPQDWSHDHVLSDYIAFIAYLSIGSLSAMQVYKNLGIDHVRE